LASEVGFPVIAWGTTSPATLVQVMSSEETKKEELPGQQAMFAQASGAAKKRGKKGPVHFKGTRSLEGLKSRIDLAIKELYRLREENHHLHKELEMLRQKGHAPDDATTVVFSESASELQSQLEHYIRIVDRYIEQEESAEEAESDSSDG